jgi:hypothetical protein
MPVCQPARITNAPATHRNPHGSFEKRPSAEDRPAAVEESGPHDSGTRPIAAEKLQQLREAYDRGSLLLFVGAGMSLSLGLPPWSALIEHMAQELGLNVKAFNSKVQNPVQEAVLAQWGIQMISLEREDHSQALVEFLEAVVS